MSREGRKSVPGASSGREAAAGIPGGRDAACCPPASVLFVGNSLTYRGGGLDNHLGSLLPEIRTGRVVKGGATLDRMLPLAEKEIRTGGWEAVVLQDDLPETTVEAFLGAASEGAALVREAGACPYLLETWPYERLGWIDARGITAAHERAAKESGVVVIPAGRAWEAVGCEGGSPDLYDSDREHPSPAGSWLAALTAAIVFTGSAPAIDGESGRPGVEGIGDEEAACLLDIALRICRPAGE